MIKTDIMVGLTYSGRDIKRAICQALPVNEDEIKSCEIIKKALKLSEKNKGYALTVHIELSPEREAGLLKMRKKVKPAEDYTLTLPEYKKALPPVIVGAGPAGLLCALTLAEAGACPIVLERGEQVEKRAKTVSRFMSGGELSEDTNIQFGEGGAGAFSDGKLKVGSMDKYKRKVLTSFVEAGAPEEILYTVGAHLGTDRLPKIVASVREKIISLGGKFIYKAKFCDYKENQSSVIAFYEKDGKRQSVEAEGIILAAGHSARDTMELLYSKGLPMEPKGFGIGARIEHKREYINKLVYGDSAIADTVGTASYSLVTHLKGGRSVYSFCMCPGGEVVAAASECGGIVTNGMSEYSRMADNSNAAILVSLTPADFGSPHPLAGFELQRRIERAAYSVSGSFAAPAIGLSDFMKRVEPKNLPLAPSYKRGVTAAALEACLPEKITDSMRAGISDFDDWMPGFNAEQSILTAPETRTTSPVKIIRDSLYRSPICPRLYLIGEGAGYAGGIVSAATDGVRCAESILLV